MSLLPTFQNYYPQGSLGPGTGSLQGQCVVFCQYFYELPQFGDSLAEKKAVFDKIGIPFSKLGGHFEIGDIVLTTEEKIHGHMYIVGDITAPYLIAAESNYRNPKHVDYTRVVPVSTLIYGVIRGVKFKVPIVNPPVSKTFMKITIVANEIPWSTLSNQLQNLKESFVQYSNNRFEPVFEIKQSSYTDIPFEQIVAQPTKSISVDWYRNNITPLAIPDSQATLFLVNPSQWGADGSFGTMTWGDPKKPVRMELIASNIDYFVPWAFHEICHALLFISCQPDVDPSNPSQPIVHHFLYQNPPQYKEMMSYVDYSALQKGLVLINT